MEGKVNYFYYEGRLNLYEFNYRQAEESLSYAYHNCLDYHVKNEAKILKFLLPVRMLFGKFPKAALFDAYGLEEYKGVGEACKEGNLRLFSSEMKRYEQKFIASGVYLMMEKLRMVTLRNLFKRIHIALGEEPKIDLAQILPLLREQEEELDPEEEDEDHMDMDDLECLVANLIYKGWIKGYVLHDKKLLILKKTEAFPEIDKVMKTCASKQ